MIDDGGNGGGAADGRWTNRDHRPQHSSRPFLEHTARGRTGADITASLSKWCTMYEMTGQVDLLGMDVGTSFQARWNVHSISSREAKVPSNLIDAKSYLEATSYFPANRCCYVPFAQAWPRLAVPLQQPT